MSVCRVTDRKKSVPACPPQISQQSELSFATRPLTVLKAIQFPVCGILGLILHNPSGEAAAEICEGLSLLQHRGQDACGIVTCGAKGRLCQCKANGMVRDVFDAKSLSTLHGGMGLGHGKSPTPATNKATKQRSNDALAH